MDVKCKIMLYNGWHWWHSSTKKEGDLRNRRYVSMKFHRRGWNFTWCSVSILLWHRPAYGNGECSPFQAVT